MKGIVIILWMIKSVIVENISITDTTLIYLYREDHSPENIVIDMVSGFYQLDDLTVTKAARPKYKNMEYPFISLYYHDGTWRIGCDLKIKMTIPKRQWIPEYVHEKWKSTDIVITHTNSILTLLPPQTGWQRYKSWLIFVPRGGIQPTYYSHSKHQILRFSI